MGDLSSGLTLAESFAKEYSTVGGNHAQIVKRLDALCTKYDLRTRSPLLNNGEHIGVRYIFGDDSFVDFYLEAPDKIFTGVGSPAFKNERKH